MHKAFVSLLAERGFEKTTVQDLLERANVGRATFYAHYSGKDALLEESFDRLTSWLRERARQDFGDRSLAFSLPLFEHADESRKLYRALVGRRGGALMHQRIRKVIAAVVRDELALAAPKREGAPLDAVVEYVVGSYLALLVWWLDHRTGLDPSHVDALFRRLTLPALKGAGYASSDREPAQPCATTLDGRTGKCKLTVSDCLR